VQFSLKDMVAVAHKHGVPVHRGCCGSFANQPPTCADSWLLRNLVSFSGGKVIGGPQGVGDSVGRGISSTPSRCNIRIWMCFPSLGPCRHIFLVSGKLLGPPPQGIGRPLKVGKGNKLQVYWPRSNLCGSGPLGCSE